MIRSMFRPPRTALASTKLASAVSGPGQTVFLHRVKIRPRSRLRSFAIGVAVTCACYSVYSSVVLNPLVRYLDKTLPALDENEQEEEDLDPLFIPLPFTTKSVPAAPYKGSDEEWQTFVKISKDKGLQTRIRNDLASIVRQVAENSAVLAAKMGKGMKVRRWWMDIDYPYRPPPEFERSGVEVTDEGIFWASRPVDSETVFRTQRVLFPSPMALSMFAFTGTLLKENAWAVAKVLGYEPKSEPTNTGPNPLIEQTLKRFAARSKPDGKPAEIQGNARELPGMDQQAPDKSAAPGATAPPDGSTQRASAKDLIPHSTMSTITNGPWAAFLKKWKETWRPMRDFPPRGCIMVSGLVELETPRGFVVIDVFAWWNPKTQKFDTRSMFTRLRRVQHKQQGPLR